MKVIVEADGGSRGNPGPAGYGAVVRDQLTGETLAERKGFLGVATNNVAEYPGLIAGLRAAQELRAETVAANTPLPLAVDSIVPCAALSTVVHSTSAIPLAVEPTMSWDSTGYGGHGGTAVGPSTRWLFAEGSQGFFDTFLLLANDNASPVDVTVRFLVEGAGVVTVPVSIAAKRRFTLFAGNAAFTTSTSGTSTVCDMATKSLSGS